MLVIYCKMVLILIKNIKKNLKGFFKNRNKDYNINIKGIQYFEEIS